MENLKPLLGGPWKQERQRFEKYEVLSETEIEMGELFQDEEDNPFLQAWGRPGRENIKLLNQWSAWSFEPWFAGCRFIGGTD